MSYEIKHNVYIDKSKTYLFECTQDFVYLNTHGYNIVRAFKYQLWIAYRIEYEYITGAECYGYVCVRNNSSIMMKDTDFFKYFREYKP